MTHGREPDKTILSWHTIYSDYSITVKEVCNLVGVKHSTLMRNFRRLGLKLRPSGFRINNISGRFYENEEELTRRQYLWFYKFTYKPRAIRKGLECSLTDDEFIKIVTGNCAYCGISYLEQTRKIHKKRVPMLTVDRVDSNKGYTVDNCVPACKECNTIKMDIPLDRWLLKLKQILVYQGKL